MYGVGEYGRSYPRILYPFFYLDALFDAEKGGPLAWLVGQSCRPTRTIFPEPELLKGNPLLVLRLLCKHLAGLCSPALADRVQRLVGEGGQQAAAAAAAEGPCYHKGLLFLYPVSATRIMPANQPEYPQTQLCVPVLPSNKPVKLSRGGPHQQAAYRSVHLGYKGTRGKKGLRVVVPLHQLVCMLFHGPRPVDEASSKPHVVHHLCNHTWCMSWQCLDWATQAENNKHTHKPPHNQV